MTSRLVDVVHLAGKMTIVGIYLGTSRPLDVAYRPLDATSRPLDATSRLSKSTCGTSTWGASRLVDATSSGLYATSGLPKEYASRGLCATSSRLYAASGGLCATSGGLDAVSSAFEMTPQLTPQMVALGSPEVNLHCLCVFRYPNNGDGQRQS